MDAPRRIPIVSIVGKSDAGKTTLLEGVVSELVARGYAVATCKHHAHEVDIDVPGKDSWRHARAGARVVMVASPSQLVTIRRLERELDLDEIAAEAARAGCDVLVTEGFKRVATVRIEVARRARSRELISEPHELVALVTDDESIEAPGVPRFALDDHRGVADFVERTFLKGARDGD
ncbi:molybdopterin-guanine dinucleotide biosynthesis protein B [Coriobacteriia bacterium Es71-Z0120]|uniref:molybdopterin-guanine dinucleotide biosynthesis protein B n=1 Tax=Parvivirga hydrogeniphila TaxID=2939460 RepID=UPI002260E534|nr:molybdopterin-guanine dinucleotide biosynthesis protein B [Parvivirga hydrogeniphila]MCL4078460.1 molybdopterin-guanine dinucleotide biosynthesis protein B [Parvivirga hydrogeniphila]